MAERDEFPKLSDCELARRATPECDAFLTFRLRETLLQYLPEEEECQAGSRQVEVIAGLLRKHRHDWTGGMRALARDAELDQLVILCSEEGDELLMRATRTYLFRRLPHDFPHVDVRAVEDGIETAMIRLFKEEGRGKTIAYLCRDFDTKSPHRVLGLVLEEAGRNVREELRRRNISLSSPDKAEEQETRGSPTADPAVDPPPEIVEALKGGGVMERLLEPLRACLEKLPPSCRSAIWLMGLGIKRSEVALHVGGDTLDACRARARRCLATLLRDAVPAGE